MYEMFLGPIEMSKPWDTKGIEGVHRFLKKLWRLFYDDVKGKIWNNEKPTDAEFKILHRAIKRIEEDNERFSFNTGVSTFMITVNELAEAKTHKKEILEKLLILLNPYAPHITEELWHQLGNTDSILNASYPALENKYLVETTFVYPISVNGKKRTELSIPLDASQDDINRIINQNDVIMKWLEGKPPEKVIYVKGRMINVVVKK
jgi:leucyl-tRNA synthetase